MKKEKNKHRIRTGTLTKTASAYNVYSEIYGNKISKKEFKEICTTYNEGICRLVLYGSYVFKMPYLGSLFIKEFDQTFKFDENGTLVTNKLKVNQNATWTLRHSLFPDKTRKEIMLLIKGEEAKYRVYHFNEHTDGKIFRWSWDKKNQTAIKNASIYRFRPTKANRRELPKIIKSELKPNYYKDVK